MRADLFTSEQTNLSPDVEQWLTFAKADLRAARLLLSDVEVPARIACFHAQQAAEKAIKAVLISEQTSFRKTHDVLVFKAARSHTTFDRTNQAPHVENAAGKRIDSPSPYLRPALTTREKRACW